MTTRAALLMSLTVTLGLAAPASAGETFDLQSYIFCPTGTWCGFPSEQALRDAYYLEVGEMNLEYRPSPYSFRALPPIIIQDNRFSTMTGPDLTYAGNGELNSALENELITTLGAPSPQRVTMFLTPNLEKCWNGIPCPGEDDGYDGDDVVFCAPPVQDMGRIYAHEMGHYWCTRHPFTGADSLDGNPVNHDGDSASCGTLTNVQDTPPDPLVQENSDLAMGAPITWHEWCMTTTLSDVDPGSPHGNRCAISCLQAEPNGLVITGYSPYPHNAMSYYDYQNCRAPFVRNGIRTEAFTPSQIAQFVECRTAVPVRTQLVDACPGPDGDFDGDGWCNSEDICPDIANTLIVDSDMDGIPDECDLCPGDADPTNADTDGDGLGDACDTDDDNDGCLDGEDQHPLEGSIRVGTELYINCSPPSGPLMAFEGGNNDGDRLPDCKDPDDDNDGIPDDLDACPHHADQICIFPSGQTCPLQPWFDICMFGGCDEMLLRLQTVINPDPTTTVFFDDFSFVGTRLSLGALPDRTLTETGMAFIGQMPLAGGIPLGTLQLDLLEEVAAGRGVADVGDLVEYLGRTYRVVDTLMTYEPSDVDVGNLFPGRRLEIVLPSTDQPGMTMAASWSVGDPPGGTPADSDGDRIPDFADNCVEVANPDQADRDRDGFGDACDPDLDQNGMVDDRDLGLVLACLGTDVETAFFPQDDTPGVPPTGATADYQTAVGQTLCRGADLNGDGVVDDSDTTFVEDALGSEPGPSGLAASPSAIFDDGFESSGTGRWSAAVP